MDSSQPEITFETVKDDGQQLAYMHSNRHFLASVFGKMYDNEESLYDVKLYGQPAEGVEASSLHPIRCHKFLLANISQHLKDLFTVDGYVDSDQTEITIGHVDHESLRRLVEFVYTDKLRIDAENASDSVRGVLIGAKYLGLKQLAGGCEAFLSDSARLNVENCLSFWCFAHKYNCVRLMHATSKLFSEHFVDLTNTDKFLQLSYKDLAELFKSPAVVTANPDQRCLAAISWLNFDGVGRSSHVAELVSLLPLTCDEITFGTVSAACKCKLLRDNLPEIMDKLVGTVLEQLPPTSSTFAGPNTTGKQHKYWYVLGGHGSPQTFLQYELESRTWTSLPNLPWLRDEFVACAAGNQLIAIGGRKDNTHCADIDEYDFASKTWLPTSSYNCLYADVRGLAACAAPGSNVYAFGGGDDNHFRSDVMCFNFVSKKITLSADMKTKRCSQTANYAPKSHSIFLAGGTTGSAYHCSVDKYDIATDQWSEVGALKTARAGFGAALSGDDLYLEGGYNSWNYSMKDVEVFNVVTGKTRPAPDLLQARDGCHATTIFGGNVVCVLGGRFSFSKQLVSVETYDVREGKWTTGFIIPNMPEGVSYFGFAAV